MAHDPLFDFFFGDCALTDQKALLTLWRMSDEAWWAHDDLVRIKFLAHTLEDGTYFPLLEIPVVQWVCSVQPGKWLQ